MRRLATFIGLAFGITWAMQGVVFAVRPPAALELALLLIAAFGPAIAAVVAGRGETRRWRWGCPPGLALLAFAFPTLLMAIAAAIDAAAGGAGAHGLQAPPFPAV